MPTLLNVFQRVAGAGGNVISRDKLTTFVEDAGVGSGLFGGLKVSKTVNKFFARFNAGDKEEISFDEFKQHGAKLLPGNLAAASAQLKMTARQIFDRVDRSKDGRISPQELEEAIREQSEKMGKSGMVAEISYKLAVALLADPQTKSITREDFETLIDDVEKHALAHKKSA
jgi:Ca2+-binding EF-hand superfamily protein